MTEKEIAEQTKPTYRTGKGSYNREAGRKTLALVSVLLTIILTLTLTTLFLMQQNASLKILSF